MDSIPKIPRAAWSRIRLFAMDVDGILTDGIVLISSDGTEAKRFSILGGLRDAGPAPRIDLRPRFRRHHRRATELKISLF